MQWYRAAKRHREQLKQPVLELPWGQVGEVDLGDRTKLEAWRETGKSHGALEREGPHLREADSEKTLGQQRAGSVHSRGLE